MNQNRLSRDCQYIVSYYGITNVLYATLYDAYSIGVLGWNWIAFSPSMHFQTEYGIVKLGLLHQFLDLLQGNNYPHYGYKLKWKTDLNKI